MIIRKGTKEDTQAFVKFLQQIQEDMENKAWFYLDPPEDIYRMMESEIMELWLAEEDGLLAGAFSIIRPGMDACNYGFDLGFTEEELLRTVNMDTAAVHPRFRGRGLQRRLIQQAEAELMQKGSAILLCTVHPDNGFSLQNMQKQGYTIRKKLEKYGSVRYVLRKDI